MDHPPRPVRAAVLALVFLLAACAAEGPAIEARPQAITFAAAPSPAPGQASATVSASASSGLAIAYSTRTPATCAVDASTGVVTALSPGTCTIAANQAGDRRWAPAPQVTQDVVFTLADTLDFAPAPALRVYDRATVAAVDGLGLAVGYRSATPAVCSVEATTGLVIALSTGDCTIEASAGALQATQTIAVAAPEPTTVPAAPTGVSASAGDEPRSLTVRIAATAAGGSPLTGYTVTSSPLGLEATGAASPVTVRCPSSCAGYRLAVTARNAAGAGPASAEVDVVSDYQVVATFHEPETQPNDSIFVGTYTLDATTGVVTGLRGRLSESMTGGEVGYPDDAMTWLSLTHQLSSVPVTVGGVDGLLVTTFLLETTGTLSADPRFGGTDGWAPGSGSGLHFVDPGGNNPGNAYARIFVDLTEPTSPPAEAAIDLLAYADCTAGGMMGRTCMTGTSAAGYGVHGTMGGAPLSQTTTRR